ncbi:MAG: hypothetical protein GY847_38140 [Proteobacteria bacterium]|nr:hypothetical protein [Pseudomonadota bacterium]
MTSDAIIELLSNWRDFLSEVDSIQIDIDMEQDEIEKRIAERQLGIDQIQKLDGPLRELAELRRKGWPQIDRNILSEAEELIQKGISLCEVIVSRDKQLIEIASEKRHDLLGQLKEASLGKGYLASSREQKIRPPVIVDSSF